MQRSRELEGLTLAGYRDWAAGDLSFVESYSDDPGLILIGTDPAEWWRGAGAKAILKQQFGEQMAQGGYRIEPGDLHAFVEGSVGWVVDNPVFKLHDGTELHARSTTILHKEANEWRVVHWHFSFGVPNTDTVGMDLTTSIDAVAEIVEQERPDVSASTSAEGTVTIIFTDIEGSTALNERLGDDEYFLLIDRHNSILSENVSAHGGSVVQRAGDGCMLAFPSARAAIECAIKTQRHLSTELGEVPVRVRMGMHTGEPRRRGDEFFGRDVAYAARVGAVAKGGEILVSRLVKELCAGATFAFDAPVEHDFKGFDGPQSVYAVRF